MSRLFSRTLREDPADAETPGHRLLLRAGYVRRVAAGVYAWLPLGRTVLDNVARIVRAEMDAIGAQEVVLPALVPREPYDVTGRAAEDGPSLFGLRDRRGGDYLLAPAPEEIFAQLVKRECSSYKDMPLILYQVGPKFRDEARPRSGLSRAREFLTKDSCSFDLDDAGLAKSYERHREAYIKIFDRLGVDYRVVMALGGRSGRAGREGTASGATGGAAAEEFLAPAEAGEDTFAACTMCDYAATVEAVRIGPADVDATVEHPPMESLDTPGTPTIETLCARLDIPASATLKNLLVRTAAGGIVAVGVPGDRDVDLDRLEAVLGPVEIFDDFAGRPDLAKGYIGPQALPADVRYLADPRVAPGTAWVTGAGESDRHAVNVVCGRDFAVADYVDVATLLPGDPCPRCGAELSLTRAIEIGHIRRPGREYCDAFEVDVLGPDGRPGRLTMGSYGIEISRVVATLAEQHHDARGLRWPREVAPADVHIVATGKDAQIPVALQLAEELEARGLRVLVDDRAGVSPGVKFTDAELIGVPMILVVGRRLADGLVELRDRRARPRSAAAAAEPAAGLAAGEADPRVEIPVADVVGHLVFPP
ncbi:MAG TPA: proline--tRNA ligase [Streptosporangiaceae bacterium]|nr:proline--tRNA ligase [Streptosporangiaceae bacterium]